MTSSPHVTSSTVFILSSGPSLVGPTPKIALRRLVLWKSVKCTCESGNFPVVNSNGRNTRAEHDSRTNQPKIFKSLSNKIFKNSPTSRETVKPLSVT